VTLRRAGGVRGKILPGEEVAAGTVAEVAVTALGPTSPLPGELSRRVPVGEAFRLGPLAPGPYSVAVVAGDRRFDLDRVVVDDGGACDLGEIVLSEPTGVVSGTVRVAGNPAAGVPLEILRLLPGGRFESVRRLQSGPDGSWRAGGLLGGPHRVVAHPRDHPLAQAEFDSRPGEPAVLDLDVPEGGRLVVRVLDAAGAPAEGARVLLQGPEGALLFWEAGNPGPGPHATGRDGVLRAVGVPAGPCRVVVDLPGKGSGEAEAVVAAGAEALLEVRLGGR
ncbi:MAG: hypothetical protein L6R43_17755, partial [Planctomycetes bacterium]|nr:hypothetical protein [Planctomycetota bacterium]